MTAWYPKNPLIKKLRDQVRDVSREEICKQLAITGLSTSIHYLDIGCDDGIQTLKYASILKSKHVYGCDINPCTPKALKDAYYLVEDINNFLPYEDDMFDVITCIEVLEHLEKPLHVLREIKRVLKPSGLAIIATPNLAAWHNLILLALGKNPPGLTHDHLKLFGYEELIQRTEETGLYIIDVKTAGYYPFPAPLSTIMCNIDKKHAVDIILTISR